MKLYISSDNNIFGIEKGKLVFNHKTFSDKTSTLYVFDDLLRDKQYPYVVEDFNHYGLPKPKNISGFVVEYANIILDEIKKGIHKPYVKEKPVKLPKFHIIETISKYGSVNRTNIIPCISVSDINSKLKEYKESFNKKCDDKWYVRYTNSHNDKVVEGKLDI